jgi:hypothetical protein
MALVTTEVTWLRWLLEDFGVSVSMLTSFLSNSTEAISIAQDGVVALQYVSSELQLADFFTKAQTRAHHQFYLSKLSVVDPP